MKKVNQKKGETENSTRISDIPFSQTFAVDDGDIVGLQRALIAPSVSRELG